MTRRGAPRARPEFEAEWVGAPAFAFDRSPSGDPVAPTPKPDHPFDQTLN